MKYQHTLLSLTLALALGSSLPALAKSGGGGGHGGGGHSGGSRSSSSGSRAGAYSHSISSRSSASYRGASSSTGGSNGWMNHGGTAPNMSSMPSLGRGSTSAAAPTGKLSPVSSTMPSSMPSLNGTKSSATVASSQAITGRSALGTTSTGTSNTAFHSATATPGSTMTTTTTTTSYSSYGYGGRGYGGYGGYGYGGWGRGYGWGWGGFGWGLGLGFGIGAYPFYCGYYPWSGYYTPSCAVLIDAGPPAPSPTTYTSATDEALGAGQQPPQPQVNGEENFAYNTQEPVKIFQMGDKVITQVSGVAMQDNQQNYIVITPDNRSYLIHLPNGGKMPAGIKMTVWLTPQADGSYSLYQIQWQQGQQSQSTGALPMGNPLPPQK